MTQSMVLYTDGGTAPTNPGFCGWGVHGYIYDTELTKTIPGNVGHSLTANGYELKIGTDDKTSTEEVIPVHYIDGYGSLSYQASNNVAELSATINGLKHASEYAITSVHVLTDSEYVRKGLEFWVNTWKNNNWLKQDNTEPANIEYWKELVEIKDLLLERGVKVKVSWIKGHNDSLGNVLADKLATIGVQAAARNKIMSEFKITRAAKYWKFESVEHNPLIANSRLFFNTIPEYIKPGEYFLGDTDKDDDTYGARTSDGAYSVVLLNEPDSVLELIRKYQSKIALNVDAIIMARLDAIYRPNVYNDIITYGELAFNKINKYRLDLFALSKNNDGYDYKEPLTYEFNPPRLCMRAVENISKIAILLNRYLDNDVDLITTDITNILYEQIDKKGIKKLKSIYNVGYSALKTNINYKSINDVSNISITLTLGIDLLNRNGLKKIESLNPKVTIITWLDAPEIIRYATIIEIDSGKAIYCGTYSNRRIIE